MLRDARETFGTENTFSGRPGPVTGRQGEVRRVTGSRATTSWTESPDVNVRRIDERVLANTGHYVDPKEIPGRYRWSLSNLRKALAEFDLVEVVDNTAEAVDRIPGAGGAVRGRTRPRDDAAVRRRAPRLVPGVASRARSRAAAAGIEEGSRWLIRCRARPTAPHVSSGLGTSRLPRGGARGGTVTRVCRPCAKGRGSGVARSHWGAEFGGAVFPDYAVGCAEYPIGGVGKGLLVCSPVTFWPGVGKRC